MLFTRQQAQAFYDRFGSMQDAQAFYEDAALDDLVSHADFEKANSVFELASGTGRLAQRLLNKHLSPAATYLGIDLSPTMVRLATERIAAFAERASVAPSDGAIKFPIQDNSIDRVICVYLFDLLPEDDIRLAIAEAHRVLTPDGKLCIASLTEGATLLSRIVTTVWSLVFRLHPVLTGGCRPIRLDQFFDSNMWSLDRHKVIVKFGVPSEVIVATPKKV
jgi:ubiquinone/menaquinone biosynthesis C-methylase UbiE